VDEFNPVPFFNRADREIFSMNKFTVKFNYYRRVILLVNFQKRLNGKARFIESSGYPFNMNFTLFHTIESDQSQKMRLNMSMIRNPSGILNVLRI